MSPTHDTKERIRREARAVGLREVTLPSLEAVERRRLQLWIVTTIILLSVGGGVVFLSLWAELPDTHSWLSPTATRVSIVALALGFAAYAIEKEIHLRRLTNLLVDERVLTASLSNRLNMVTALLDAGKAMNAVLELRQVLDIILRSALDLLGGRGGSVMLVEEGSMLRAVCVHGSDSARGRVTQFGEGIAGHVAATGEPLLLNGDVGERFPPPVERDEPVESAMCVPLINRGDLVGVLNINAADGRRFTEFDLRALSLFAEQAAVAIANARLYEQQRSYVEELLALDRMKSEFVASVSHDLRTPLTAVLGAAAMAQRPEIDEEKRTQLIEGIQRQARRLADMIEQMLAAKSLEHGDGGPRLGPLDVAALARSVVSDFEMAGNVVSFEGPAECRALADTELMHRILSNLIDNAFKYGAPPVGVTVRADPDAVVMSVLDAGPGIPPEKREEIFERFRRLDASRRGGGLGLGLSIVRALTQICGGTVEVGDAPGGGAAFHVTLRPAESQAAEAV